MTAKFIKRNNLFKIIILLFFTAFFLQFSSCSKNTRSKHVDTSHFLEILKSNPNSETLNFLFHQAQEELSDSTRVDILLKIYKKSIRSRPIRNDILDSAINQAKRLNYKLGIAEGYNKKGLNYRYALDYQKSVDYHLLSLEYYKQTTDTFGLIKCLNSLGVSLRRMNYERKAMDNYLEALRLSRLMKNYKSIAVALNGIGNVFVNIEQYEKALPYFKEALAVERKNNNRKGMNYDLSNIGEVYMYQKEYDSALYYYNQALNIAKDLDYKDNASIIYNCMGQLYQLKEEYEKSNSYYDWSIDKLEKFNGKRYLSNTYINMGMNYCHLNKLDLAKENIEKGMAIALDINSRENIILAYQAFSNFYDKHKNYDLALTYYKKTIAMRDSVRGEITKQNINELEAIYENEIKDSKIKEYQFQAKIDSKKTIILWMLISFMTIAGIILFFLFQLKRKNDKLALEQMRNDIQEYIHKIEYFEKESNNISNTEQALNSTNEVSFEDEKSIFYKNIKQYGLSQREMDVLLLISEGLKNDEIANKLFLSLSTIKTHTRNIFIKLDVRNRIEATRKAQNF